MGLQSFRGAGGGGAITVRPARWENAANEYDLHPIAQELTAREQHAADLLVKASTAAAVATGLLVTTWLLYG